MEQRQPIPDIVGMLHDFLNIQIGAQPRTLWRLDIAVVHLHRIRQQLFLPGIVELIENLMNEKVRGRHIQMSTGDRTNWPLRAVRSRDTVGGMHHAGNLLRGGNAKPLRL